MRTRLLVGALLLVGMSAAMCATLTAKLIEHRLSADMRAEVRAITKQLSRELTPVLESRDRSQAAEMLTMAMEDPRLAFLALRCDDCNLSISRVRDGVAWDRHARLAGLGDIRPGWLDISENILRDGRVIGKARREALWPSSMSGQPIGFLTIGVIDRTAAVVRASVWRISIVAACLSALAATPFIAFVVRRVMRPMRRMTVAVESLADGRRPDPLPTDGPHELAALSRSFNSMACQLLQAHNDLHQSNADLDAQVRARTEELRRVNDLLQLELKEKDEFLRTVSHDLNAPLRNIAGMTGLILQKHADVLPTEAQRRLERIAANVELETTMLDDLLTLSRISTSGGREETIDCTDMARSISRAFEHETKSRDITLTVDDDLPRVNMEPARMRTVLQNLIDNAIKYMGDAKKREIRVSGKIGAGGASITVSDSGPGIPEHEHDRVFMVFRRGESSEGAPTGRGVGLAAVRATVERWSGKVTLQSRPGEGASFTITIPPDRVIGLDEPAEAVTF